MITYWFLIRPSEDGESISVIAEDEISSIKKFMTENGITRWLDRYEKDHMYWEEGDAMLVKAEVKVPKTVKVVEEYILQGDK